MGIPEQKFRGEIITLTEVRPNLPMYHGLGRAVPWQVTAGS